MSPTASTPPRSGRLADASLDAAAGEDLRAEIETVLVPGARMRFSPELEARYQDATWRGRSRSLIVWLCCIALIDFLCIGIDALVMPLHIVEATIVRGFVLTPIYLGAAVLLMRQRPVWMQGMAILVPTVSIVLAAGYLAHLAGGIHTERYLIAMLFTIFGSTIVPNVAFRWIVAQTVLSVGIFAILLFTLGVTGARSLADNVELVTFFPVAVLVGLHVRRWIERMHRRNFLMTLRDELRLQDLALSKARRDATLANMSQGIIMREPNGYIPVINRRAVELLGLPDSFMHKEIYSSDILRHQRAGEEFNDPSLPPGVITRLRHGDERDVPPVYERTRPDGTVLEVRSAMLPDGGLVRTYTDITERKRTERALAEARDAAEAHSRARSEFLAMMSHEIRTPMNAVLGLTGSLLETPLDKDQRKAAEAIQEASDGLLNILNDILDLSKLDAGRLQFETLPFSFGAVIDNAKSMMAPRAAEKGLALRVALDPNVPKALKGDPGRIRQIVLNLVSNAVKFTAQGEVAVAVDCVRCEAGKATIRITVRDTGIGIAPDRLQRLFTDFVQADASVHRRYGGTGLGLAICKRLVEQMGGEISVESTLGQGSTLSFWVTLPVADVADLEMRSAPSEGIGLRECIWRLGRPLRLLIAEDNATNQMVVTRLLREFDITLHIACDGAEAVAAAKAESFDAIFMDMRMPVMDGLEAARAIRALGGELATIPIIALTANAFADDVKACRDAGMSDFCAKPVRKKLLVEKLAAIAEAIVTRTDPIAAPPAPPAPIELPATATADVPLIDWSEISTLAEEIGADAAAETIRIFRQETDSRLTLMRELAQNGNRATIEIEAHTLKGAAGTIGFPRLSTLARTLEKGALELSECECAAMVAGIETAFRKTCDALDARRAMGL